MTTGPGLSGALQVGLAGAKGIAYSLGVPLYGVHHLAGHVAADTGAWPMPPDPCTVLIVSGGHTSLLLVRDLARDRITHLGDTLDDAAGECFDKVARVFGLPYPGGPAIDRTARAGDPRAVPFPRPLPGSYDFSFSGLKTAAARWAEGHTGRALPVADGAASLQEAVADVLTRKAVAACEEHGVGTLVVVGGVAANSRVRSLAEERCRAAGIELRVPPLRLCTDNGAMIAAVGDLLVRAGAGPAPLDVSVDPSVLLEYAALHPVAAWLGGGRPMTTGIRVHTGTALLAHTGALRSVYADAFCAPPWTRTRSGRWSSRTGCRRTRAAPASPPRPPCATGT
ncbi:tRNA N6-adenosine threonylcarbamoyltransferase, mitochondrial [Streptomyces tanashiensis]